MRRPCTWLALIFMSACGTDLSPASDLGVSSDLEGPTQQLDLARPDGGACLPSVDNVGGERCVLDCSGGLHCFDYAGVADPLPTLPPVLRMALARDPHTGKAVVLVQHADLGFALVTPASGPGTATSTPLPGLPADTVSIGGGDSHFCALGANGDVWCFGRNDAGNLGASVDAVHETDMPMLVSALGKVSLLAVGGYSTCGVVAGETRCVGDLASASGQVASVPELAQAKQLFLGGVEVITAGCAIRGDGAVSCKKFAAPEGSFTAVALSDQSACGLEPSGTVRCWGHEYDYVKRAYVDPTPIAAPTFRTL